MQQLKKTSLEPLFYVLKWIVLSSIIAVLAGSASALFLFTLDWATNTRKSHHWLIWLLPLAGFSITYLYMRWGKNVDGGINVLIDQIDRPSKIVELRMAPMVFLGTIASHLFGASVGREGTAVQMGGSLADQLNRLFKLNSNDRQTILMAGMAAGFASLFGTPLAGAVFAIEVLVIGRMRYTALLPCFLAAILADKVGLAWGAQHTHYIVGTLPEPSLSLIAIMILAGAIFGLTAKAFSLSTALISGLMKKHIRYAPLRPFIIGLIIAILAWYLPIDRFLGLGIPNIIEAFDKPIPAYDFLAKFALTVSSLGAGFKGGEVTPLFYIGATLGNALAQLLQVSIPLLAGVGFVAVFAGAANTPIASTLMAIELFGGEIGVYAAIACAISYLFSGHSGIYKSQAIGVAKQGSLPEGLTIGQVRQYQKSRPHNDKT